LFIFGINRSDSSSAAHGWHERVATSIGNDDRDAVPDVRDETMGGSQIDAYAFAH
jgi:hypothetical protein